VSLLRLQWCRCKGFFHAAARLVNGLRPHDHVTSALKELHWLPIKQRVDYKLCLLVLKVTVRQAPSYLTGMLTAVTSEAATRPEHCGTRHPADDASGARRATAQTAALANGLSAHPVQASHTDVQDPPYNQTILSQPPHPVSTISSSTSIFF